MSICTSANIPVIECPDYISLYADGVEIKRVEFGKKQTTLYFNFCHYTGKTFQFRPSTYLVDEKGQHYPARSCQGFKLGEWTNAGKEGVMEVSISFDALPEGTRVFDCIEGPDLTMSFQFYGIREKGRDWNVFSPKEVADNPFEEDFFRIDTVYVTGRITKSRYDRLKPAVHEILSNSQQHLLQQYRENHGILDLLYVNHDGTFSFKTIVAKPCMDDLNLNGIRVPILLIPGDSLHVDISHLGEYNQKVVLKSKRGDYSRVLANTPFMYDRELADPRGTLIFSEEDTLSAESWQPLHDKQKQSLEICRYIAAKYHFTQTELKLMCMDVLTTNASISILRMQAPILNKYRKEREFGKMPERHTLQGLLESGIHLNFSFLMECPWNDPTISVTTNYESIPKHLHELVQHIQFLPDTKQYGSLYDSLNLCAAAKQFGVGDMLMLSYMMKRKIKAPHEFEEAKASTKYAAQPHTKSLMESAIIDDINLRRENYLVNQTVAAKVIQKLVSRHMGKKIVLMPINWYKKEDLNEKDSLYRVHRMDMDKEAVLLPIATSRFLNKKKLKELQRVYPILTNTTYLKKEDFLHLSCALQFQLSHSPERLLLPDGTYNVSARSFFDKFRIKQ